MVAHRCMVYGTTYLFRYRAKRSVKMRLPPERMASTLGDWLRSCRVAVMSIESCKVSSWWTGREYQKADPDGRSWLSSGCFEHYPNLKPIDASIKNVARIHDWIHHYDRLHHRVGKFQEFELMGYMPYAVVPWHTHMAAAANTGRAVDFPKTDYEAFFKTSAIKEIGTALHQSIPANLRTIYNASTVLTELGPYLMRIISPPLKPVCCGNHRDCKRAFSDPYPLGQFESRQSR